MAKVKTLTRQEILEALKRIEVDCFRAWGHIQANYEADREKARASLRETLGTLSALVEADWKPEAAEWATQSRKKS